MAIGNLIKDFWENESDGYKDCVQGELNGFKKEVWRKILQRTIHGQASVLDIGTGPGFFAVLLAEMGCKVTAIDVTNNMIEKARTLCESKKNVQFLTMDSHNTAFADNTFDFLICRNVTWTLDNPPKAYREWFRILKESGKLIIFDANFNLHYFDPEIEKVYRQNLKLAEEKGYTRERHKDEDLEERLSKELFLSDKIRPQWDLNEMLAIGFKEFYVDTHFDEELLTEEDRLFWGHAPSFMIVATK